MNICAIDTGYSHTKVNNGMNFESRISQGTPIMPDIETFKLGLEVEGEFAEFTIGKGASGNNRKLNFDNIASVETKILVYTALCAIYNTKNIDIKLMLGTPVGQYKSQKENLMNYIKSKGEDYSIIKFNGEYRNVRVADVRVFPQSVGAAFTLDKEYLEQKIIGIIDIGGYTIDLCIMQNGTLINSSIFTLPKGIIPLKQELMNFLNQEYGTNLNEITINQVMKQGFIEKYSTSRSNINSKIDFYVRDVINKLIASGWDTENMEILLTGGGAISIGTYFKKYIPNAKLMPNPQFSNVRGFYNVAKTIFN